jgi:hypothetical protein
MLGNTPYGVPSTQGIGLMTRVTLITRQTFAVAVRVSVKLTCADTH